MENNLPCPETHLTKAILITIFCCLPFGIASIIHASRVSSSYILGNYEYAMEQSQKANKWANIGIIVGAVYYLIYMTYIGIVVVLGLSEL